MQLKDRDFFQFYNLSCIAYRITELRVLNRAYVVTGSACLRAFFSNSTNLLVPAGSYFGVLNLRIGCRSGLTKGII